MKKADMKCGKSLRALHICTSAKPGTPKKLACDALWKKGGQVKRTGSKGGGK